MASPRNWHEGMRAGRLSGEYLRGRSVVFIAGVMRRSVPAEDGYVLAVYDSITQEESQYTSPYRMQRDAELASLVMQQYLDDQEPARYDVRWVASSWAKVHLPRIGSGRTRTWTYIPDSFILDKLTQMGQMISIQES